MWRRTAARSAVHRLPAAGDGRPSSRWTSGRASSTASRARRRRSSTSSRRASGGSSGPSSRSSAASATSAASGTRTDKLREENLKLRRQAETYADVARENARIHALLQLEGSVGRPGRPRAGDRRVAVGSRALGDDQQGTRRRESPTRRPSSRPRVSSAGRSWAGANSAKVLLLTDAQSAVGVRIGASGETGLARGTGGRNLELELVSRAALDQGAVKPGDDVLTSGYQGGIYPPGCPVGRVEDVQLAARGTSYTITRPSVRPVLAARHRLRRGVDG